MSTSSFQVGFIGVGRMGANMARRLKDEHYRVVAVHDIDRARADDLARELECERADTPARVAALANIVITVVTDDHAMRAIFSPGNPESLLAHVTGRTFINCATLSPGIHVEIEKLVEPAGGHALEACLAGSIPQARQGTLFLMCGGRRETFERVKPLLAALSATVRYVGEVGRAASVKALVNMVMNCNTAALAEGLGLGAALGLDLTMLREVFAQSGANSRVLETDGEDMQYRAHECYFSAAHAAKDSAIALALAESVGLQLPLAGAAMKQYRRLIELGKGELDKSAVAELTFKGRT